MSVEIIRAESTAHFRSAADLHVRGITEGFLSTLGTPFLAALYGGIATADESGVFVAEENGEVLGFISCARDVKTCYKRVLKSNWPSLAMTMIPNAFKPAIYKKIIETLSYPLLHRDVALEAPAAETAGLRPELLSMAVSELARGRGVGKMLVKAVDEDMSSMRLPGYYVVTHGSDERSNGFYLGRGFVKIRAYQSHGKPMNEYLKKLS